MRRYFFRYSFWTGEDTVLSRHTFICTLTIQFSCSFCPSHDMDGQAIINIRWVGEAPRCTMSSLASTAHSNRRRDYYDGNYRICSSGLTYFWPCFADSVTIELGTLVNRERVLSDDASNSLKLKCGKYAVTDLKSRAVSSHFDGHVLNLTASGMLRQYAV